MKLRHTKCVLPILALLAMTSCGKKDKPAEMTRPVPLATMTPVSVSADAIQILDPSGKRVASIQPGATSVIVVGPAESARTFRGEMHGIKCRYLREDGAPMFESKPGDDGFKLHAPEGKLVWKVKFKEGKIKVSDNEENARPIVLKSKDGKVEVEDNDVKLGEVSFDEASSRAKIKDVSGKEVFTVETKKPSAAFGLQLATRIPEMERAFLQAEILSRGL